MQVSHVSEIPKSYEGCRKIDELNLDLDYFIALICHP